MKTQPMNPVVQGALAGCAATLPMTVAMVAFRSALRWREQGSLPPHQVTMDLAQFTDVKHEMTQTQKIALTTVNHFGYGTAMGALYGGLIGDRQTSSPAPGVAFGLGVWAASYLGWLPVVNSRASAHRQGWRRNVMMIGAHVVWGASVGMLCKRSDPAKPAVPSFRRSDLRHGQGAYRMQDLDDKRGN